ncbi:hypothetical protein [Ewingella americana]|uniref:Uncharacterized protein n=1 Tax=Ewingella americana TaxID=41202 RepID=A0A502G1C1_9GAMM|nr:hypothetical protein [Ewingella americana]TPG55589.1 hypothetical protein EAH77_23280 [Ewingella americana]
MRIEKAKLEYFQAILSPAFESRMNMIPISSKARIQEEVFRGDIFSLKLNSGVYACQNIDDPGLIRIPNGKWIYVVTVDNPFELILMAENDIENMVLKTSKTYLGHTSLTRELFDTNNSSKQNTYANFRLKIANRRNRTPGNVYAKDVYLAGDMLFRLGILQEWTNDSGHYRIKDNIVKFNIPAPLSHMIPIKLFKNV